MSDVTRILSAIGQGDPNTAEQLLPQKGLPRAFLVTRDGIAAGPQA